MMGDSETEALMIREVLCHCYDALFQFSGLFLVNVSAPPPPPPPPPPRRTCVAVPLTWNTHCVHVHAPQMKILGGTMVSCSRILLSIHPAEQAFLTLAPDRTAVWSGPQAPKGPRQMQHELAAFASPNGAWAAQLTGKDRRCDCG
eukprot:COSAG04_NODE_76_length_28498_cov_7.756294_7_plen_145_part_00